MALWECCGSVGMCGGAGSHGKGRSPEEMFLHAVMAEMGSAETGGRAGERSGSCFSKGMSQPRWDPTAPALLFLWMPPSGGGTACLGKESLEGAEL